MSQCIGEPSRPPQITVPQSQSLLETSQITASPSQSLLESSQITALQSQSLSEPSQIEAFLSQSLSEPSQIEAFLSQSLSEPSQIEAFPSQSLSEPSQIEAFPSQSLSEPFQITASPSQTLLESSQISALQSQSLSEPSQIEAVPSQSLLEPFQITALQSQSLFEPSQTTALQSQSLHEPLGISNDSIPNAAPQSPGGQIFLDRADRGLQLSTATGFQSPRNAFAAPLSATRDDQTSNEAPPVATSAIDIESDDSDSPSKELYTQGRGIDSALKYIADRVESSQRAQHLVRVTRGSSEALQQPPDFYNMLWSGNDNVFAGGESDSKLCRLYRGRKKIDKFHQQYECASRLSLVFLTHDIEAIKSWDWTLGPGQSRQYAAVLWIAHHLGVSPEDIKDEWRRSQNYVRLLEACGPGVLLELGTGVNWW